MSVTITGDKELQQLFRRMGRSGVRRATRSGVSKGGRVAAKAIKQRIPGRYKDARRAIGSRLLKKDEVKGDEIAAKVGGGVGKSRAKQKDRSGRDGVGLSKANIHWAILGTDERFWKTPVVGGKNPHPTGRMPPILAGVVRQAVSQSKVQVQRTIREGILDGLAREQKKKSTGASAQ